MSRLSLRVGWGPVFRSRTVAQSALVLATALLILGGWRLDSAQGSSHDVIDACVHNNSEGVNVRIVAPDAECRQNETPRHWAITGPAGPAGPAGPTGPAGAGGVTGLEWVFAADDVIGSPSFQSHMAVCPEGKIVLSGGAWINSPPVGVALVSSGPSGTFPFNAWTATAAEIHENAADWVLNVAALCAEVP